LCTLRCTKENLTDVMLGLLGQPKNIFKKSGATHVKGIQSLGGQRASEVQMVHFEVHKREFDRSGARSTKSTKKYPGATHVKGFQSLGVQRGPEGPKGKFCTLRCTKENLTEVVLGL